jgi:hypothetical protein
MFTGQPRIIALLYFGLQQPMQMKLCYFSHLRPLACKQMIQKQNMKYKKLESESCYFLIIFA